MYLTNWGERVLERRLDVYLELVITTEVEVGREKG